MNSPLRQQMTNAMVLRGLAARTIEAYIAAVLALAKYYRRSPATLSGEELQAYLLHLITEKKLAYASVKHRAAGLLYFLTEAGWRQLKRALYVHRWVVYAKAPLGGPAAVLEYLARYTHRVPDAVVVESVAAFMQRVAHVAQQTCPHCKAGRFVVTGILLPVRAPEAVSREPP